MFTEAEMAWLRSDKAKRHAERTAREHEGREVDALIDRVDAWLCEVEPELYGNGGEWWLSRLPSAPTITDASPPNDVRNEDANDC